MDQYKERTTIFFLICKLIILNKKFTRTEMDRIYLFNINSKKMNSSLLIGICKCLKIAQINKCQLYNTKLGFIYQTYLLKRAIEYISYFVNCPCGQKKHKVCNRVILVAVQTGTGKIDPARKIKCP